MCKIYKEVLRLVAEETEISADLIQSKSRLEDVVSARQMVAYFCSRAGMSPSTIAQHLGISRQAVCQKIQSIADKRHLRSFRFNFDRISTAFENAFPEGASNSQESSK